MGKTVFSMNLKINIQAILFQILIYLLNEALPLMLEILKNPKTYDMMLYPTEFNSKNIKVNVNKSCMRKTTWGRKNLKKNL